MKKALQAMDAQTVQFMLFNFLSSTGIIFTNKYLAKHYQFRFSVFLTACHFVITYSGVLVCRNIGMYKAKRLNHMEVLPITLAFVGFVVFNNLSLQENSVGFYQLAKVLTTPVIAILQYIGFGIDMDYRLKLAMIPVIFGVILASVSDVQFNALGCFWAVAGILSTSYYQIFVKTKQKSLNANSFQVLQYQAPQAAIIVFILSPFLDGMVSGKNQLKDVDWSNGLMMTFFLSCCLAFCVNLSIFLVVGKTSPISYNVLGHMKLLVILTGSVIIFGEKISTKRFFGMLMAFGGIVYYTHVKIMGNAKKEGWDKKSGAKETEMVEEGKSLIRA
jgi:solute carrier family 35 protein E3